MLYFDIFVCVKKNLFYILIKMTLKFKNNNTVSSFKLGLKNIFFIIFSLYFIKYKNKPFLGLIRS